MQFIFVYAGVGTVLCWQDTEMKNIIPTLPYERDLCNKIFYYGSTCYISPSTGIKI